MAKAKYDAIRIAKELCYSKEVILRIKAAKQKAKSHEFCTMQGRQCNV